ncbi:TenA family transcriptional regulator [Vibrio salinus]|uniref:TenA family transcriptional regulator n=1 Tax=Vibrio salinus TaxID=2899784 RepID=UPI001E39C576|nr:iron-containing redox enzyme family protein [Vibrio salinus]MCE0494925.1 iron-containing redox enzyme family protein [Vibrio salinus]
MIMFYEELVSQTSAAREYMMQAPVIRECVEGQISLDQYVAFLEQAYHHVKHTVPLLMACGSKLPQSYEWVREAIAEYIEEEKGHQYWILDDIACCGYDAKQVENGRPGRDIELMVSYLYHLIDRDNPMGFFGMVLVLEGTSVAIGGEMAKHVKENLNLSDNALTYLTSHCELDQEHLQFFAGLMNKVESGEDQNAIIHSANMIFHLYGDMLRTLSRGKDNGCV